MSRPKISLTLFACLFLSQIAHGKEDALWPGFVTQGSHHEQAREVCFADESRAIILAPSPDRVDPNQPILLIVYATPNGNTAEQTLGCQLNEGMDWHFDIQHIAAQWRQFSSMERDRTVVLACVQTNNLSWPTWKSQRSQGPQIIHQIIKSLAASLPNEDVRVVLTGHSGGGSFLFGYLDSVEMIPYQIERIAFLDANYGYDSAQQHSEKFLRWINADPSHHLIVLAYDDRNIELNGKKVVSPTGGTFRATHRMLNDVRSQTPLVETIQGEFLKYVGLDGQFVSLVHPNPENRILHTRLVGEMNGLLAALTIGTPYQGNWSKLASSRAYSKWIDSDPLEPSSWQSLAPSVQPRALKAPGGSAFVESLFEATPTERESALVQEILRGNVPDWWRDFKTISTEFHAESGETQRIAFRVSPDYLAIGGNEDFVRVPLTPSTAQHLADMLGCVLPTRMMVDAIYNSADVKLSPKPLIVDRESLATFLQHNQLIERQMEGYQTGQLIAGIKKDIVVTNELVKRPGHVAIYGWHQIGGKPIQPLTTVHVDRYVDYSHGIRLIDQWADVNGKPMRIEHILRDESICKLLSDEGPLLQGKYRTPPVK